MSKELTIGVLSQNSIKKKTKIDPDFINDFQNPDIYVEFTQEDKSPVKNMDGFINKKNSLINIDTKNSLINIDTKNDLIEYDTSSSTKSDNDFDSVEDENININNIFNIVRSWNNFISNKKKEPYNIDIENSIL